MTLFKWFDCHCLICNSWVIFQVPWGDSKSWHSCALGQVFSIRWLAVLFFPHRSTRTSTMTAHQSMKIVYTPGIVPVIKWFRLCVHYVGGMSTTSCQVIPSLESQFPTDTVAQRELNKCCWMKVLVSTKSLQQRKSVMCSNSNGSLQIDFSQMQYLLQEEEPISFWIICVPEAEFKSSIRLLQPIPYGACNDGKHSHRARSFIL